MAKKSKYTTISIPASISDEIAKLKEELGYWPSVSAFAREACIDKIREEKRRLREAKTQ